MPSGRRHYRLTLADALGAHERALQIRGGAVGIPNISQVESAIGRPYVGYYRSIHRKAAALVHSMAANHGFADGNKRTATILMDTPLVKSGYDLQAINGDQDIQAAVEKMVLDIVEHRLDFDGWSNGSRLGSTKRVEPSSLDFRSAHSDNVAPRAPVVRGTDP